MLKSLSLRFWVYLDPEVGKIMAQKSFKQPKFNYSTYFWGPGRVKGLGWWVLGLEVAKSQNLKAKTLREPVGCLCCRLLWGSCMWLVIKIMVPFWVP